MKLFKEEARFVTSKNITVINVNRNNQYGKWRKDICNFITNGEEGQKEREKEGEKRERKDRDKEKREKVRK